MTKSGSSGGMAKSGTPLLPGRTPLAAPELGMRFSLFRGSCKGAATCD